MNQKDDNTNNLDKTAKESESIWDRIARDQHLMRELALSVRKLWHRIPTLPDKELVRLTIAITSAGEDYDGDCKYRERLINAIRDDYQLFSFAGLRLPVRLCRLIEKRIIPTSIPEDVEPFPPTTGRE